MIDILVKCRFKFVCVHLSSSLSFVNVNCKQLLCCNYLHIKPKKTVPINLFLLRKKKK